MVTNRFSRIFADVTVSAFNISAQMLSMPGDFLVFRFFIACFISTNDGGSKSISRSSSAVNYKLTLF